MIFGDKRKQHASPSRHRSATRNGRNTADISSPGTSRAANKHPINLHDWAIWRTHLNEQMGFIATEANDLNHLREFLHSNQFYQQHSRDPSTGRYNGVRLLFSIPHAKLKSDLNDGSRNAPNKNGNMDINDVVPTIPPNVHPIIDDRPATSINSVSIGSPPTVNRTISQLLPKNLIRNANDFLQTNEQIGAVDMAQTR